MRPSLSTLAFLLLIGGCQTTRPSFPVPVSPTAEIADWSWSYGSRPRVVVLHPQIARSIDNLRIQSATFAAAWDSLHHSGYLILIGSDRQLRMLLPESHRDSDRWVGLAYFDTPKKSLRVRRIAVAVRLETLERMHEELDIDPMVAEYAFDQLVVHEIYGHVVPVALWGSLWASCPDERRIWEEVPCVDRRTEEVMREVAPPWQRWLQGDTLLPWPLPLKSPGPNPGAGLQDSP